MTADDHLERRDPDDPAENERFLDEELVPFLVFAGALLALFPEPATSALGVVLVGVGLALWLFELLR